MLLKNKMQYLHSNFYNNLMAMPKVRTPALTVKPPTCFKPGGCP